jgi:hypothetical protein
VAEGNKESDSQRGQRFVNGAESGMATFYLDELRFFLQSSNRVNTGNLLVKKTRKKYEQ